MWKNGSMHLQIIFKSSSILPGSDTRQRFGSTRRGTTCPKITGPFAKPPVWIPDSGANRAHACGLHPTPISPHFCGTLFGLSSSAVHSRQIISGLDDLRLFSS